MQPSEPSRKRLPHVSAMGALPLPVSGCGMRLAGIACS